MIALLKSVNNCPVIIKESPIFIEERNV